MFVGGIFFIGSLAGPLLTSAARKGLSGKSSLLKSVGNAFGSMVNTGIKTIAQGLTKNTKGPPPPHLLELDTTYTTPLTAAELQYGKTIQIVVYGEVGEQTLQVKIPAGSRSGQKHFWEDTC